MARAKKKQKQASRHENWISRDGNQRPTEERRSKGPMRLVDGENAGESYAYSESDGQAGLYRLAGVIDDRQLAAAREFERIARANLGSPSGRSCLNDEVVGWDDEEDSPLEIANSAEWRELGQNYGAGIYMVLASVCWQNEPVDRREHTILRNGLDIVADFYKI